MTGNPKFRLVPKEEFLLKEDKAFASCLRGYVSTAEAKKLFSAALEFKWLEQPVVLCGKTMMSRRKVCYQGEDGLYHRYSGISAKLEPWDPEVKKICDRVNSFFKAKGIDSGFNSCLLNYYKDGHDCIGYHSDKESENVATLSLGGTRKFYLKRIKDGEVVKTALHSGDLCLMYGTCQSVYKHSIPKETSKTDPVSPRISLTFRKL